MADESYWQWYGNAFGNQPTPGPSPGPDPLTPAQWADFYRSVGITGAQGNAPTTKMVASVPFTQMPLPRPRPDRVTTIATYPTVAKPPTMLASVPGPSGYINDNKGQERLPASGAGMTAPLTPTMLAALGVTDNISTPFPRPRPPTTMLANNKVAPVPFDRPTAVATALDVVPPPPLPIPRPINRGQPMPPLPLARPGIGGPAGPVAPTMGPLGIKPPALPIAAIQQAFTAPKANLGSGGYNPLTGTFNLNLNTIQNGFSGPGTSGGAHGGSADNHPAKFNAKGQALR